jgi:hypothetical protein
VWALVALGAALGQTVVEGAKTFFGRMFGG